MMRLKLSEAEEAAVRRRYRAGESCGEIGKALGRGSENIRAMVRRQGGFSPRPRRRHPRQLSLVEREEISRGLSAELSARQIAAQLGRAASSISREIRRHGGRGRYRALPADQHAWQRARRPKRCKLAQQARLRKVVIDGLGQRWSPRQIAQRLPRQFPCDHSMRVSHETIYRSLFIQARGALKEQLLEQLRSGRKMRRARTASALPSRQSADVMKILSQKIGCLPVELRRSLTWDRGLEMANHKEFTIATDVQVYFCDPHSPWQRGSNENTNGLLRQYFPKGTDLSVHSQAQLDRVAVQMNGHPRETLGFDTPAERLNASVALTA